MTLFISFFFFNDTATTEIYTLSLHDALPIFIVPAAMDEEAGGLVRDDEVVVDVEQDRKSTRLNSSHSQISYAVFCLKKKKNEDKERSPHHDNNDALSISLGVRTQLLP